MANTAKSTEPTTTAAKAEPVRAPEPDATPITLPGGRTMTADDFHAALDQLAAPFRQDQVEKLPKALVKNGDKYQCRQGTPASADGYHCGGYHARSIHLDYVGHAGVTDRLNAVDPFWTWEPMALTPGGTPLFSDGGMWIRLTILGITRLGFGDAAGKSGPSAVKEVIGDAIRNGAMRFGVATYLWSKSDAAKAVAAGGDPDADANDASEGPSSPASATEKPSGGQGPSEASQRVWAAYNVLSDHGKAIAQRTWPKGVPGPDYVSAEHLDAVMACIRKAHDDSELPSADPNAGGAAPSSDEPPF